MPKTNLKVYANLPTWDTLSESVKSLINFFMKNASMVFRGDYQGTSFQYMSGNVRNKYYSSFDKTAEHWNSSLELNIPYFEFNPVEEYPVVDGFPDGNSTVSLLTSSLELLELSEDGTSTETDLLSGGIPIPVILTPKSGETVINNPRLKPKDIKTNYHHIVEIPIETDGLDFMYDFQLRSSSFYIDDGEGGIEADVFYKIGICPFQGNSMESIMESLQENKLSMKLGDFLFYKLLDGSMAVGKKFTADGNYKFSTNLAFPLSVYDEDDDAYTYVGMAYIELYNQDGTLFNQDISDKNIIIYCRPSENESPEEVKLSGNGLQLTITDQKLDSGFIYTEYETDEGDDITKPLKFVSRQDGSVVRLNVDSGGSTQKYSVSTNGRDWSVYSEPITLNEGKSIYFKANTSTTASDTPRFAFTGVIESYNNINSLLDPDFENITSLVGYREHPFLGTFRSCTSLTKAPLLPATVLTDYCYSEMFYGCTSLTQAPELPATTLAYACYGSMFLGCTALTQVSGLPALSLPDSCYSSMFYGCTSLVQAPTISATNYGIQSCYSMFRGCTSLTQVPDILATTLGNESCYYMFRDCTSLVNGPSELPARVASRGCYEGMFYECTSLTRAPNLSAISVYSFAYEEMFFGCKKLSIAPSIPATFMGESACYKMFRGCSSLIQPPPILATRTLYDSSYSEMFLGCTKLTSTPDIQATTLASKCYKSMFHNCTSLTQAPSLPVTKLSPYCYQSMFFGCTKLASAPELPATQLAENCYDSMFRGCTSLTQAPELPATTLAYSCYNAMFQGCSKVKSIRILATDISSPYCLLDWLSNVSYTGDFYCVSGVDYSTGASGIPSGWSIHYI